MDDKKGENVKLYAKYVASVYLKYLFIIFIALEFFYVGIDVLTNLKDIPQSANSAVLYVTLTAGVAITYTLPLSIVFALIITNFNMIRSNELVSFYALGVSKTALIVPPFLIALFITLFFIYLNTTPFAYALKFQKNLTELTGGGGSDMFLKFDNKYVYIKNLKGKNASGITVFDVKDGELLSKSYAKNGVYEDKVWKISDFNTTILPKQYNLGDEGLKFSFQKKAEILDGFDPNSIESVYDSANVYSITEAIRSIKTFGDQGVNVSSIKANLYNMLFFPMFAPLMVIILYFYMPVIGRFFNLALLSFGFFIVTLVVWGLLFVCIRFSLSGVIIPELGIILPILLLSLFAMYLVFKQR